MKYREIEKGMVIWYDQILMIATVFILSYGRTNGQVVVSPNKVLDRNLVIKTKYSPPVSWKDNLISIIIWDKHIK